MDNAAATYSALDDAPLTRSHLVAVLIVGVGWFCDVVAISVGSVLSALYSAKSSLVSTGALSWVVASLYLGALIGALAFGWAADRFGRRRSLIAALAVLAASACGAALSPGIGYLILCRALSGLAVGAFPVVAIPYVAEVMPARARGRMLLIAAGIGAVALPATLLGARVMADSSVDGNAWRWIYAICGAGSALTALAVLRLPESSQWLRSRRRTDSAGQIEQEDAHRVRPGVLATFTILLNVLSPWSTVGFPILSGAVLVSRGFSLTDSFLFTGLGACGIVLGLFAASWKIDAFERRTVLIGCALLMGGCGIAFALVSRSLWIVVAGVLFNSAAAIYIQALNIYLAEMFATRVRALGTSSGSVVNRLTSACVPLVLLPILHSQGAGLMSAIQAGTIILSAALLALAPRGYAARAIS